MKSKFFPLVVLIGILAAGLVFVGCDTNGGGGGDKVPEDSGLVAEWYHEAATTNFAFEITKNGEILDKDGDVIFTMTVDGDVITLFDEDVGELGTVKYEINGNKLTFPDPPDFTILAGLLADLVSQGDLTPAKAAEYLADYGSFLAGTYYKK